MRFSDRERAVLLAVKGVGPKVVERLEEQGLGAFEADFDHMSELHGRLADEAAQESRA